MKKWVYIKTYERIVELYIDEEAHSRIIDAWQKDEKIALRDMNGDPLTLSGKYDVYTENQYKSWVDQNDPKQFISRGVWLDGKERKRIRNEPWKEKEINDTLKIKKPKENTITPEQFRKQKEKMYQMMIEKGLIKKVERN
jgi:hypothetical protein